MFAEEKIREAFSRYEMDGMLSVADLGTVIRSLGQNPSMAELQAWVKERDPDETGFLDFDGFLKIMGEAETDPDTEEELREAFRMFDRDGSGHLDAAELRNSLSRVGEPLTAKELDELFQNADIDGDGKINYDEFAKITMKG